MAANTVYTPFVGAKDTKVTSVYDQGTLDRLKKDSQNVSKASATDTSIEGGVAIAKQFEALFIHMMLKQARQSMPEGLLSSDATKMAQSMSDEQLALNMAQGKGIGLAPALVALMKSNQKPIPSLMDSALPNPIPSVHDFPTELSSVVAKNTAPEVSPEPVKESRAMKFNERLIKGLERARGNMQASTNQASSQAASGITDKVVSFIERMKDAAVKAAEVSGIHPELILSQAALETGWGQREITTANGKSSYNVFGIKATSDWKGKVTNVITTEYVDGVAQKMVQPFRTYNSYEESFADYAQLLSNDPRYKSVLNAKTPKEAAIAVQKAGYATDPQYANKLHAIMDSIGSATAS